MTKLKQGDKLVPTMRLGGFTDEWETKSLVDVVNIENEARIPIASKNRCNGNTPYYGAVGIQDYVAGYTHDGEYILLAEDGATNLKPYPSLITNGKIWVNNHAHVLSAIGVDLNFLKGALDILDFQYFVNGTTRYKLNKSALKDIYINIPPTLEEQKLIGQTLKAMDDKIQSEIDELHHLKQIKEALLGEFFPEEGKLVPRRRFDGFDGEWGKLKLKDISKYRSSQRKVSDANHNGQYKLYDASGVAGYISEYDFEDSYVSIIKDGSGSGRVSLSDEKSSIVGTMGAIIPNNNIDVYFLFHLLSTIDFSEFIKGSTIPHVYYKDYSEMDLYIPPTFEEQQQIGKLFKTMDDRIEAQEMMIKKDKQIKLAILSELFV